MKVAIIDLGTNTSNLLIAENSGDSPEILYQQKQLVRMGDNQIKDHLISEQATERVLSVLKSQKGIIESEGIEKVRIVATSAVRGARNKKEFLKKVSLATGYPVEVITGDQEAELIFKGILLAMGNLKDKSVILDIGGGSVELIVASDKEVLWKESKPTGMARIINKFALSDPIKAGELQILQNFFSARHHAAFSKCRKEGINTLVGCSGTFDTIADILDQVNPGENIRKFREIALDDFYKIYNQLINSTRAQRMEMKGMDSVRVDLIVPAIVFIDLLIKQAGILNVIQTGYALREGVLYEMHEEAGVNKIKG